MRPRRRPGAVSLPVGAMMALTVLVVAVVLVFGAFQQQSANEQRYAEVADRDRLLDQREASLDQRRAELDQREDSVASQELALADKRKAIDRLQARMDERDASLKAREQALESGVQALNDAQAALAEAQSNLAAREQKLRNEQAEADAKLAGCAELQKAVDGALGARTRIASRLQEALRTAGIDVAVDGDGGASLAMDALFHDSSAILTKAGQRALDAFLPVWYGALNGESLAALSVEALAPPNDPKARDLSARRAAAIVEYASDAPALDDAARAAFRNLGLSGVRPGAEAQSLVAFRVYLNNDALRKARMG